MKWALCFTLMLLRNTYTKLLDFDGTSIGARAFIAIYWSRRKNKHRCCCVAADEFVMYPNPATHNIYVQNAEPVCPL